MEEKKKGVPCDPKPPSHLSDIAVVLLWSGQKLYGSNGTDTLAFIDDSKADAGSSMMNTEVYRSIQPNASKLIGQHFIIQQDNDPTHKAKTTKKLFRLAGSTIWFQPDGTSLLKAERSHKAGSS